MEKHAKFQGPSLAHTHRLFETKFQFEILNTKSFNLELSHQKFRFEILSTPEVSVRNSFNHSNENSMPRKFRVETLNYSPNTGMSLGTMDLLDDLLANLLDDLKRSVI